MTRKKPRDPYPPFKFSQFHVPPQWVPSFFSLLDVVDVAVASPRAASPASFAY